MRRGEISIANEAAKRHFGPLPRGASLRGSLSPIARDIDTLAEAAALDGFASRTVLFVMGRGECWYDVSARRVDRPRAGLIWRLEEITERKRRETAHIAENEVLARTLRDLDVDYCILTPEGRLHTVSDSLGRMARTYAGGTGRRRGGKTPGRGRGRPPRRAGLRRCADHAADRRSPIPSRRRGRSRQRRAYRPRRSDVGARATREVWCAISAGRATRRSPCSWRSTASECCSTARLSRW